MPGCSFGMRCFQKGTGAGPPNPPLGGRYPLPQANPLSLYFRCLFWPPSWSWVFLAHLVQPLPSPRSFAILAALVFLCVLSLLQSPDQIFICWVAFLWSSPSRLNIWKILLIFLLQTWFFFPFFKLPLKSFFLSEKHHPTPGVALAFFLPRRIWIFEKRPSRCLFTLHLLSCKRDGVEAGGSWLLLSPPGMGSHGTSLPDAQHCWCWCEEGLRESSFGQFKADGCYFMATATLCSTRVHKISLESTFPLPYCIQTGYPQASKPSQGCTWPQGTFIFAVLAN